MPSPLIGVMGGLQTLTPEKLSTWANLVSMQDQPKKGGGLQKLFSAAGNIGGKASGVDPMGLASLGIGAVKNLQANRQQKAANAMFPGYEDPEQRMLANEFRRRKRAYQTGTAMSAELANQRALAKQGINAAFKVGGGQAGLNRMSQLLGQAMLGNKEAGMRGEMAYSQMYGDQINKLAQTRLEKALLRYNTAQAQAAQTKTDSNRMLYGGLARVLNPGQTYDASTGYVPESDVTGQNYGEKKS